MRTIIHRGSRAVSLIYNDYPGATVHANLYVNCSPNALDGDITAIKRSFSTLKYATRWANLQLVLAQKDGHA